MNLTGAQSALLDRLVAAVEQVPGVEAIWLSGSLACGEGDEFSDIDLHAAINGEAPGAELERWRGVARSAGAVFARATPGPGGILVNAVTGDGSRFDLVIHATSHLALAGPVRPLRDDAGLLAAAPIRTARAGPGPEQVTAWTEEFLRSLLLLSVVGPRGEWIAAEIGSLWMLGLLKDLMLAENGEAGAGSALRLGRRLNEEQRAVLLGLPPLAANERDVTRFQAALANDFLPRARRLCGQLGAGYPEEFEAAVRKRIGDRLTRALIGSDPAAPSPEPIVPFGTPRYDAIADFYDERHGDDVTDSPTSALLDLLGPVADMRILDLACGQGRLARELARRGARSVAGLDISARLVELARSREVAAPLGVVYMVGDAGSDGVLREVDEGAFDVVVCNMALTDLDDLRGTLASVARATRYGGLFLFSILHPCFPGAGPIAGSWDPARGYAAEGWWTTGGSGIRGKVGSHHRPLGTIFNALIENGLVPERIAEPAWGLEHGGGQVLADLERVPGFLVVRTVRVPRMPSEPTSGVQPSRLL